MPVVNQLGVALTLLFNLDNKLQHRQSVGWGVSFKAILIVNALHPCHRFILGRDME